MNVIEIILLAISLSMDAFAVSICRGLALKQCKTRDMVTVGLYFGVFQWLMPLGGYSLGMQFETFILAVDNIIPPVILSIIGGNMVRNALEKEDESHKNEENHLPSTKIMLGLAIATSIDAFAVGVTFIPLKVAALPTSIFIGCTTFLCSAIGVKIGHLFGLKYKSKAEFVGGFVLILIAIKIFFQ
ncbi:MAG: manganese efflux pump MntP family protein [Eubacteriales bacterium]